MEDDLFISCIFLQYFFWKHDLLSFLSLAPILKHRQSYFKAVISHVIHFHVPLFWAINLFAKLFLFPKWYCSSIQNTSTLFTCLPSCSSHVAATPFLVWGLWSPDWTWQQRVVIFHADHKSVQSVLLIIFCFTGFLFCSLVLSSP